MKPLLFETPILCIFTIIITYYIYLDIQRIRIQIFYLRICCCKNLQRSVFIPISCKFKSSHCWICKQYSIEWIFVNCIITERAYILKSNSILTIWMYPFMIILIFKSFLTYLFNTLHAFLVRLYHFLQDIISFYVWSQFCLNISVNQFQ